LKLAQIVILALSFLGNPDTSSAEGARNARHVFLPFIGYQTMTGEQVGVDYTAGVGIVTLDTVIYAKATHSGTRYKRAPMFGVLYRYIPNERYYGEAMLAVIHDKSSRSYPFEVPLYNFVVRSRFGVERSNTTIGTLEFVNNLHSPANWLGLGVRGGVGMSLRRTRVTPPAAAGNEITVNARVRDAERMYIGRLGLDFTIWNGAQLVATGSVFYTRFIPVGGDTDPIIPGPADPDPFGGMGWRLSFFPIWSIH
jgi:hypothetical protein